MNSAMLGGVTALSWGTADFAARFSGRALGHENALLGMLVSGSILLTGYVWLSGIELVWAWGGLWLVVASGLSIMLATLLLYQGIARGPISLVTPIASSYPVLVVLLSVIFRGARPSLTDYLVMGMVFAGVYLVARHAVDSNEPQHAEPGYRRTTLLISGGASLLFCIVVFSGQAAAVVYGEVQATWMGRLVSLACLLALFAVRWEYRVSLPVRWWPVLFAQGLLDSLAYVALFAAGTQPAPEMAAVTASGFGAVTAIYARVFLREHIAPLQAVGMVMVFSGVGWLSLSG